MSHKHTHKRFPSDPATKVFFFTLLGRRSNHCISQALQAHKYCWPFSAEEVSYEKSREDSSSLPDQHETWISLLGKLLKSVVGFQAHVQVFGLAGIIFKCGMQNPTQWLLQRQTTIVFLISNNAVIYGGAFFSLNQNLILVHFYKQLFLKECCCAPHLQTLREQLPATTGNGLHQLKVFMKPHQFCSRRGGEEEHKTKKPTNNQKNLQWKENPRELNSFYSASSLKSKDLSFLFQTILLLTQWITDLTNSINGCSPSTHGLSLGQKKIIHL